MFLSNCMKSVLCCSIVIKGQLQNRIFISDYSKYTSIPEGFKILSLDEAEFHVPFLGHCTIDFIKLCCDIVSLVYSEEFKNKCSLK